MPASCIPARRQPSYWSRLVGPVARGSLAGGEQSATQPSALHEANEAPGGEPEEDPEEELPEEEEPEEEEEDPEEDPDDALDGEPDEAPDEEEEPEDVPDEDPDDEDPDDDDPEDEDPEDESVGEPLAPPSGEGLASVPHAARAQWDASTKRPRPDDRANMGPSA
jgi:hypothetical protein